MSVGASNPVLLNGVAIRRVASGGSRRFWAAYLTLPCMLWLGIWLGINSGPDVLTEMPGSLLGCAHYVRTLFPFFALLAMPVLLNGKTRRTPFPKSLRWWVIYGFISLFACALSPEPMDALYWIGCYFSVLAVTYAQLIQPDPLQRMKELNQFSWVVASVFLAIMVFMARDTFVESAAEGGSYYSAYGQMETAADMAMSRSSGLARFSAIPGLVAFVLLWRGKTWHRVVGLLIGCACGWFVWQLQSRGAIFGFAGAVVVSMLMLGTRTRVILMLTLTLALLGWTVNAIAPDTVAYIADYLSRGQDAEEFRSFTGRTDLWLAGLQVAVRSPILGFGPQADRFIIGEHIHNTYMYALLQGGVCGLISFVIGLGLAWTTVIKLLRNPLLHRSCCFTHFVQAVALLTFFTIRSVTEVSGAMFAVDLMIMVPAIAYVGLLSATIGSQKGT